MASFRKPQQENTRIIFADHGQPQTATGKPRLTGEAEI